MLKLKQFFSQSYPAFSNLLNYAAVVDEGVVLGKDGSFIKGWEFQGDDLDSATDNQKSSSSARINRLLVGLDSSYMIHTDCVRKKGYEYVANGVFADSVTSKMNESRKKFFEESGFITKKYLFLTWLPPIVISKNMSRYVFPEKPSRIVSAQDLLEKFKKKSSEFEDSFRTILKMNPLRQVFNDNGVLCDSLLAYINYCISGRDHLLKLPTIPMYLDTILGGCEFVGGESPKINNQYIGVVSIDGFPSESYPGILEALGELSLQYRWSTRFICMDSLQAKSKIKSARRKWQQKIRGIRDQLFNTEGGIVNMDAASMTGDAETALSDVSEGTVSYGYYTSVIIIMDDKKSQLDLKTKFVVNVINELGFNGRIETFNAIEGYLGSLPGNGVANISRPLIHTLNLSDILPISTQWEGNNTNPCSFYPSGSPPLSIVMGKGSTPFNLNIHCNDVGHTLIFGPTGTGKSTLLAFFAAQFRRYKDATIFAFDKGKSLYALTKAVGGKFYDVGSSDLSFSPINHLDSDIQKMKAQIWLEGLIQLQGVKITPYLVNEIHSAMELLVQSSVRTLSDFKTNLQNEQLRSALEPYVEGGNFGKIMDAERDDLSFGKFQTFEMTTLLEMGDKIAIPVLLYLFNRIDEMLTGQPAIIILDEAWVMLGHDVFRERIREWLKVKRKENCAVILATQSLSDAKRSGILDVLNESCPTKIYLANPGAMEETSAKLYASLGCNEKMIEIISTMEPKRHYYYSSPDGQRIFDLVLDPESLAFVGASSKKDLAEIESISGKYGDKWPRIWAEMRMG